MIVVDTSAWIEFLRGTGSPVDRTLGRLLREEADLAVTELIVAEVLSGARTEAHHDALRTRLLAFPVLPLRGLAGFEAAARMYRECRRLGVTVRKLADCLIAVPATEAGAAVLHSDADFDGIARCTGLAVHRPDGS